MAVHVYILISKSAACVFVADAGMWQKMFQQMLPLKALFMHFGMIHI